MNSLLRTIVESRIFRFCFLVLSFFFSSFGLFLLFPEAVLPSMIEFLIGIPILLVLVACGAEFSFFSFHVISSKIISLYHSLFGRKVYFLFVGLRSWLSIFRFFVYTYLLYYFDFFNFFGIQYFEFLLLTAIVIYLTLWVLPIQKVFFLIKYILILSVLFFFGSLTLPLFLSSYVFEYLHLGISGFQLDDLTLHLFVLCFPLSCLDLISTHLMTRNPRKDYFKEILLAFFVGIVFALLLLMSVYVFAHGSLMANWSIKLLEDLSYSKPLFVLFKIFLFFTIFVLLLVEMEFSLKSIHYHLNQFRMFLFAKIRWIRQFIWFLIHGCMLGLVGVFDLSKVGLYFSLFAEMYFLLFFLFLGGLYFFRVSYYLFFGKVPSWIRNLFSFIFLCVFFLNAHSSSLTYLLICYGFLALLFFLVLRLSLLHRNLSIASELHLQGNVGLLRMDIFNDSNEQSRFFNNILFLDSYSKSIPLLKQEIHIFLSRFLGHPIDYWRESLEYLFDDFNKEKRTNWIYGVVDLEEKDSDFLPIVVRLNHPITKGKEKISLIILLMCGKKSKDKGMIRQYFRALIQNPKFIECFQYVRDKRDLRYLMMISQRYYD